MAAGLGKALLGLRVIGLDGGRPGFARALSRSCIFALVNFLRGLGKLLIFPYGAPSAAVAGLLFEAAATVVLFFRARRGNGFAGLHDRRSATRVVLKRAPEGAVTLPGNHVLTEFEEYGKIGPYSVIERICGDCRRVDVPRPRSSIVAPGVDPLSAERRASRAGSAP